MSEPATLVEHARRAAEHATSAPRREAAAFAAERGLPTRRDEDWRWTDVSALADGRFVRSSASVRVSGGGGRARVVREVPAGDVFGQLADPKAHAFVALNAALFEDVVRVEIEPGAQVAEPIEIEISHAGGDPAPFSCPRVLVVAGARSRAVVVERHVGTGEYASLAVTEIALERDAVLDHVRLQRESDRAWHVATLALRQARDSRLRSWSLALGGRLARVDLQTLLAGEGAACRLLGLVLGGGSQLLDHHTLVDHALPRTESRQLYKSILDGHARGVFRGRVHVRPHAQKIDASQLHRSLLLSDDAVANAKPQLEIHAHDVKCSHGASIGRLSEDALFYLRARGIPRSEARAVLTLAFAREVTAELPEALRGELDGELARRLHAEDAR
jgi:Fe-S cluster assembly protein SufD